MSTVDQIQVWRAAAGLLSEHGENQEYDRAVVEMVADIAGIGMESRRQVYVALVALNGWREYPDAPYPEGAPPTRAGGTFGAARTVLNECHREINRTLDNADTDAPSAQTFAADIVRRLTTLYPEVSP